jgi:hypothetical protein
MVSYFHDVDFNSPTKGTSWRLNSVLLWNRLVCRLHFGYWLYYSIIVLQSEFLFALNKNVAFLHCAAGGFCQLTYHCGVVFGFYI